LNFEQVIVLTALNKTLREMFFTEKSIRFSKKPKKITVLDKFKNLEHLYFEQSCFANDFIFHIAELYPRERLKSLHITCGGAKDTLNFCTEILPSMCQVDVLSVSSAFNIACDSAVKPQDKSKRSQQIPGALYMRNRDLVTIKKLQMYSCTFKNKNIGNSIKKSFAVESDCMAFAAHSPDVKRHSNLESLSLVNCSGALVFLDTLHKLTALQHLDLSFSKLESPFELLNNAFQVPGGAKALTAILQEFSGTLVSLNLQHVKDIALLHQAVLDPWEKGDLKFTALQKLNMSGLNSFIHTFINIVSKPLQAAKFITIKELTLRYATVNDTVINQLVQSLVHLVHLDIAHNTAMDGDLILTPLLDLQTLNLYGCELKMLKHALQEKQLKLPRLTIVNLGKTCCDLQTIQLFIRYCPSLEYVGRHNCSAIVESSANDDDQIVPLPQCNLYKTRGCIEETIKY